MVILHHTPAERRTAVIIGAHSIIYTDDAEATRAFFRDKLGMASVDAGEGWLIFALPPGEIAAHPSDPHAPSGHSELYLMCDDVNATLADLKSKGVEQASEISDQGWGLLTSIKVPGAGELGLYQPRHEMAINLTRQS
jgi:catechol 2,3-dioxygenase-like lactoylglutathione lyase family enzyme